MAMAEQTAVEWLLKQFFNLNIENGLSKKQYLHRRYKIEKEAKQMEKDRMVKAFQDGARWMLTTDTKSENEKAKEYFNELYEIHSNKGDKSN